MKQDKQGQTAQLSKAMVQYEKRGADKQTNILTIRQTKKRQAENIYIKIYSTIDGNYNRKKYII